MPERQTNLDLVGQTFRDGRLTIVSRIGKGTFGAVYNVVDRHGRTFACKVLFPYVTSDDKREKAAVRRRLERIWNAEVRAHVAATGHARILRLHEYFVEPGDMFCFTLDLCLGGTLFDLAATPRFWRDDAEIKRVFTQLIDGVRHCHSRGVAHRDLKPENVLTDATGTDFFLADFGLATLDRRARAVGAGSILYTAPEAFRSEYGERDYDTRVADIWSLGIILINMVCGIEFVPWLSAQATDDHFARYLHDPARIRLYLPISSTFLPLLLRILDPEPRTRITLSGLRKAVLRVPRFLMDDGELVGDATEQARESMKECSHSLGVPYTLPPLPRNATDHDPTDTTDSQVSQADEASTTTATTTTASSSVAGQRHRRLFSFKMPFGGTNATATPECVTPCSTEIITPPDSPILQTRGDGGSDPNSGGKKMTALMRGLRFLRIL